LLLRSYHAPSIARLPCWSSPPHTTNAPSAIAAADADRAPIGAGGSFVHPTFVGGGGRRSYVGGVRCSDGPPLVSGAFFDDEDDVLVVESAIATTAAATSAIPLPADASFMPRRRRARFTTRRSIGVRSDTVAARSRSIVVSWRSNSCSVRSGLIVGL